MASEPTRTLIDDLEAAADVLLLRERNDIQPALDSTLGRRLREAAGRLREEMAYWDVGVQRPAAANLAAGRVRDALMRINGGVTGGGPLVTSGADPGPKGCKFCDPGLRDLMRDVLQRIAHDPGTAKNCQGCRTAIGIALEGLGFLASPADTKGRP